RLSVLAPSQTVGKDTLQAQGAAEGRAIETYVSFNCRFQMGHSLLVRPCSDKTQSQVFAGDAGGVLIFIKHCPESFMSAAQIAECFQMATGLCQADA